jgi:hypothetical protein
MRINDFDDLYYMIDVVSTLLSTVLENVIESDIRIDTKNSLKRLEDERKQILTEELKIDENPTTHSVQIWELDENSTPERIITLGNESPQTFDEPCKIASNSEKGFGANFV